MNDNYSTLNDKQKHLFYQILTGKKCPENALPNPFNISHWVRAQDEKIDALQSQIDRMETQRKLDLKTFTEMLEELKQSQREHSRRRSETKTGFRLFPRTT